MSVPPVAAAAAFAATAATASPGIRIDRFSVAAGFVRREAVGVCVRHGAIVAPHADGLFGAGRARQGIPVGRGLIRRRCRGGGGWRSVSFRSVYNRCAPASGGRGYIPI